MYAPAHQHSVVEGGNKRSCNLCNIAALPLQHRHALHQPALDAVPTHTCKAYKSTKEALLLTGMRSMSRRLMPMVMVVREEGQEPQAPASRRYTCRRKTEGPRLQQTARQRGTRAGAARARQARVHLRQQSERSSEWMQSQCRCGGASGRHLPATLIAGQFPCHCTNSMSGCNVAQLQHKHGKNNSCASPLGRRSPQTQRCRRRP